MGSVATLSLIAAAFETGNRDVILFKGKGSSFNTDFSSERVQNKAAAMLLRGCSCGLKLTGCRVYAQGGWKGNGPFKASASLSSYLFLSFENSVVHLVDSESTR